MSDPAAALPETRYVESDGLSIAWQVFGSGTQDLVVVPPIISHVDANWQYEGYARMLRRLGESFRVIIFDKRGQGMSDRFEGAPTLEERMDDLLAVMQAAGSERAILFASSEGGAMGALFAATHPARVERLVLYAAMARFTRAPDYPIRPSLERMLQVVAETWGTPRSGPLFAPSRAGDAAFCETMAHYQRLSASPSAVRRLLIANDQIDVRQVLPQIRRPTLIIHRRGDRTVSCANGRYLADQVPDAVYLELPGADHMAAEGDPEAIIDAIVRFAAARPLLAPEQHAGRWLATVLFADIVGSTELAARLGDADWRDLLARLHDLARAQVEAHRGRIVDTAGDGWFALFDGPARAIRCAAALLAAFAAQGVALRAGLHTGEVESGGGDKVSGMAVHVGARVMATAGAGEVRVSNMVKDLVAGAGIAFDDAGTHALKGVPGEWLLWRAAIA
ncbi:MAG: adenylate/guanylate cyclase domain-containing protein [Piscinibacter sp.]|nr:adenylate/guanylate cyclase domain-containing protein [Piscinibacter sp.]